MKVERTKSGKVVHVELTRRNLLALLDKLDDPLSARTIGKADEAGDLSVWVTAVEDSEHYSDRAPGVMYSPSSGEYR